MSFMPVNPRPMLQELYVHIRLRLPPRPLPPLMPQNPTTSSPLLPANDLLTVPKYSVNKDIVVRLKWGETEYKGRLVSIDSYMNIQLTNAQEYIDRKFTSDLGQILIRCNNVLWIKGAGQGDDGDVKMEG
ncbi:like-Sm domain-containing protein [Xylariaceae sp. FL0016]|nr:like-Sm domain-containing protein [Xylariaceae sp. FL0016]